MTPLLCDGYNMTGLGLLVDSAGLVSLVMARTSAAADLGLGPSDPVVVEVADGPVGTSTPVTLGTRTESGGDR